MGFFLASVDITKFKDNFYILGVLIMYNHGQEIYEIHILGHIDKSRFSQFTDIYVTHLDSGKTVIRGSFGDQPELHGLLNWIGESGITLLSVRHIDEAEDL